MGDRFYMQQKNFKPKRKLKKDVIAEITALLGVEVEGLDKCTIATLDALIVAITNKQYEVDAGYVIDTMARAMTGAD